MISLEDRHRLHQFLMLMLAVQYLKKDLATLQTLKYADIFVPFVEKKLPQLLKTYEAEKTYFAKKNIHFIKWQKIDVYFSRVYVTTAGEDAHFTYANQAVKTQVVEIVQRQLGLI